MESNARVSLNEIRDLLEALDARAYSKGFEDGQRSADDRSGGLAVGPKPVRPTSTPGPRGIGATRGVIRGVSN
jgi:hypothetical protein